MDKYDISKDDKGWKFGKEGSDRALRRADTKEAVTDKMRDYMKDKEGSVKIFRARAGEKTAKSVLCVCSSSIEAIHHYEIKLDSLKRHLPRG